MSSGKTRDWRAERSAAKRAAIIEGAMACFLRTGYAGTSVDEIAATAGVSKQTVYQHFGGKERLFTEIAMETIDDVGRPFFERLAALDPGDDPKAFLCALARALATIANERRLIDLRRLVIAEALRFPQLARAFAERAPGRTIEALAETFARLDRDGVLRIPDPYVAGEQFNWLVLAVPVNRAMFDPGLRFTEAELERHADEAVRVFLAAYPAR